MRLRISLLSLILLLSLLGTSVLALAQGNSYEGLDILFLVDQSASMGRVEGGGKPNDPLGLRFYAPWYAMYWMGEDRLLVHEEATFRMAVVSFGSTTDVWNLGIGQQNPHWQTIDPVSRDEWEPIYSTLTDEIEMKMRAEFSQRDLGATDFVSAFQAAKDTFDELPESSGERLRVVIVLTDGQPYISQDDDPNFSVSNHMNHVQQLAAQYFHEPDYRIYVIGMINASAPYWPAVRSYWEDISNDPCTDASCPEPVKDRASMVASNNDVGNRFQEILQDLTGKFAKPAGVTVVDQAVVPGELDVPPYLKSIAFTYFKADLDEHLVLNDSQGELDLARADVSIEGLGGPIEVVHIANPQPGKWFVATDPSGTDVDITMRQIFAISRLDSPKGVQTQFIPLTIQYGLLDDLGQLLPIYSDPYYRLFVTATVEAAGQSWPIQLTSEPDNVYTAEFTPVVVGAHTINVHAESQDLEGNPVLVFDGEIGNFNVSPAILVPIDMPASWAQYEEGVLTFELQDNRGLPVSDSAPLSVTVTIDGESGSPLILDVQPNGTYRGTYTPQQTGQHGVHVTAKITDSSGNIHTVADIDALEFDVIPTVLVSLTLLEPQETQQNNTGLWPFDRTPLVLEVQINDTDGHPLDPTLVFAGDPGTALAVSVTDKKRSDLSGALVLEPTKQRGLYHAETTALGSGEYDIHIEAVSDLQDGYLYQTTETTVHVTRVIHPWHLPIAGGFLLLFLLASAVTMILVAKGKRARAHPCIGNIKIVDAYGSPRFQTNLTPIERNRIEFTSKDISSITHVNKMIVTCNSEHENESGHVNVEIWLDVDSIASISQPLRPQSEVKLGKYNFWLLKDPSDEQLLADRSNQISQDSMDEEGTTWGFGG